MCTNTHTHTEVKGPPSPTVGEDPRIILTLKQAALHKLVGFHKFISSLYDLPKPLIRRQGYLK